METPPPKIRSNSFDQSSGSKLPEKVQAALHRPQTTDLENTNERKHKAQKVQRQLEEDFNEAKDRSTEKKPASKPGNEEPDPQSKPNLAKPKAPGTTLKKNAKGKAKAKATKAPSTKGKQASEEEEEEEGEQPGDDHAAARSSQDTPPRKPEATTKQEGSSREGKKKDATLRKAPKEPQEPKEPEDEEEDYEEKKKLAHKLYMRFWRNVHGRNPRIIHRCIVTQGAQPPAISLPRPI